MINLAVALALAATGPGRYSADPLLAGRLPKPFMKLAVAGAAALTGYNALAVVRSRRRRSSEAAPPKAAESLSDHSSAHDSADPETTGQSAGTRASA